MRAIRLALWPLAVVLGVAAESAAYAWDEPRDWMPDLATGWVMVGCGLVAWSERSGIQSGPLLTAAGLAWFAPNFANADRGWIAWLAAHALYLHRGPLVHLVATYPSGRLRGRLDAALVAAAYASAIVAPVWRSEPVAILLSALLVVALAWSWSRAAGRERHYRLVGLRLGALLALVLTTTAAGRLAWPGAGTEDWTLLIYEAALAAIAVGLVVVLLRERSQVATVTNLVVELGETRSGTLRDALAQALGDPSLEVGYWLDNERRFVDAEGRRLELPAGGSERSVTRVDWHGRPIAALVHDPAVLDDPGLLEALRASARLAAANVRLQAAVREQLSEVAASRLRLLRAGDEERRRLDGRLRGGAEARLEALRALLDAASGGTDAETRTRIERARERLDGALVDLRELASGLHPRALVDHGLEQALTELAGRSPTEVDLRLSLDPLEPEVETAVYFVCSEALANVAKHAALATVTADVTVRDGVVLVDVRDDGPGGADPAAGGGLAGLADRVAALGGTLRVDSPGGTGTWLHAEVPLEDVRA